MSEIKLDKLIIQKVANLSRIDLNENETERLSEELSKIINFFQKISEINTSKIEPLSTPFENENFLREDIVHNEFTPEEMVENAPSRQGSLFKVPPVV
jgi:aspartyl-tRNA(Asn)/glutamyl-tRNA(Gln) amidotransferase subunit C